MGDDAKKSAKDLRQVKAMQSAETFDKKKPSSSVRLDRDTRAKLGHQLRAMYDEVVSQGVPDRFSALLNRLDDTSNRDKK